MNDSLQKYIHHHTTVLILIMMLMFIILSAGEVSLYRSQVKLNKMISEGLMQIKEEQKMMLITPTVAPLTQKLMKIK